MIPFNLLIAKRRTSLNVLLALVLGWSVSVVAAIAAEKGWVLNQSSPLTGQYRVYITRDALKIVNVPNGISYITKAPDWQVLVCNDRQKTYCQTGPADLEDSQVSKIYFMPKNDMVHAKWRVYPNGKVEGLNCIKKEADHLHPEAEADYRQTHRMPPGVYKATYVESTDLRLPPAMGKVFRKVYVVPLAEGIPISSSYLSYSGIKKDVLGTDSVKRAVLQASDFEVPKNYKDLKFQRKVTGDTTSGALLEDLSGFFSNEKDSKEKKKGDDDF